MQYDLTGRIEDLLPGWKVPTIEEFLWMTEVNGNAPTNRDIEFVSPEGIKYTFSEVLEQTDRPDVIVDYMRSFWSNLAESGDPGAFSTILMCGEAVFDALQKRLPAGQTVT